MDQSFEYKLLIRCCQFLFNETGNPNILPLLEQPIDWQKFSSLARQEEIASLCYYVLMKNSAVDLAPKEFVADLQKIYQTTIGRNLILYEEVNQVTNLLQAGSFDVVLLKGLALTHAVFPHPALRASSDIDLLVKKDDLALVQDYLIANGYRQQAEVPEPLLFYSPHPPAFFSQRSNIHIDVHWTIGNNFNIFKIDINDVWSRVIPAAFEGHKILQLSLEDTLLHLCFHTIVGHSERITLRRLFDIAAIVHYYHSQIQWRQLLLMSEKFNIEAPVFVGLSLVTDLFSVPVPDFVLEILKSKCSPTQLSWLKKIKTNPIRISRRLNILFWSRSNRAKLMYLLGNIFPPPGRLAYCYSIPAKSWRLPFFYLYRPVQLLSRYGFSIIRLMYYFLKKLWGRQEVCK